MVELTYAWVYLDKNKDYVYCFKREGIIEEQECDYYEHNIECDNNGEILKRTHLRGTLAGYKVIGVPGSIMKGCKYCLKNGGYKKYYLPLDAKINQQGFFNCIWEMIRNFFK